MAPLALAPVLPEMHIVVCMAAHAIRPGLLFGGRQLVTAGTARARVGTGQLVTGRLPVIELPDAPAVGRVAGSTVRTERAHVFVGCLVAVVAVRLRALVGARQVTLFAGYDHMQTDQRKVAQIVVERDVDLPAIDEVAVHAIRSELSAMHILRSMAAHAIRGEFLRGELCGVAAVAGDLRVPARERPLAVVSVIKASGLPLLRVVTARAIGAQASGMVVPRPVAPMAILRQLIIEPS